MKRDLQDELNRVGSNSILSTPKNQVDELESRLRHMQRVVEVQQEELLELYRRLYRLVDNPTPHKEY